MAIPDFQSLMLPVLHASANGEVRIGEVVETLADSLKLTDEERATLLPSGKQTTFANRVHWAKSYLGKARLVDLTGRGRFQISDRGRAVVEKSPPEINIKFLEQFPEFVSFRNAGQEEEVISSTTLVEKSGTPPDELMRQAHAELEETLGQELLQRIQAAPPAFFERLVVRLLIVMGYGGSAGKAGAALVTGKSNDGGVDGLIDQDALGLDRVYVQAKRYADGNSIGSPAIRDFFGALDSFKAAKGMFITTSSFSPAAIHTASTLSKRIVLIDGKQLVGLMILHNVGCRVDDTLYIKSMDEEFFEG
ncbi:MAG: restriction endonuclease [Planctomycetes bacterium]|nr:restriction endonuclease [Planctomycetota bacterium]